MRASLSLAIRRTRRRRRTRLGNERGDPVHINHKGLNQSEGTGSTEVCPNARTLNMLGATKACSRRETSYRRI